MYKLFKQFVLQDKVVHKSNRYNRPYTHSRFVSGCNDRRSCILDMYIRIALQTAHIHNLWNFCY